MLKYTSMKLELLSDYDMLLMIEKGIRGGGLTQASMRYAKANNENTPDYEPSNPKSWLVYQDYKIVTPSVHINNKAFDILRLSCLGCRVTHKNKKATNFTKQIFEDLPQSSMVHEKQSNPQRYGYTLH
ncbi:hypothetical protein QTP88_005783 [Uroleucon formosanum]